MAVKSGVKLGLGRSSMFVAFVWDGILKMLATLLKCQPVLSVKINTIGG